MRRSAAAIALGRSARLRRARPTSRRASPPQAGGRNVARATAGRSNARRARPEVDSDHASARAGSRTPRRCARRRPIASVTSRGLPAARSTGRTVDTAATLVDDPAAPPSPGRARWTLPRSSGRWTTAQAEAALGYHVLGAASGLTSGRGGLAARPALAHERISPRAQPSRLRWPPPTSLRPTSRAASSYWFSRPAPRRCSTPVRRRGNVQRRVPARASEYAFTLPPLPTRAARASGWSIAAPLATIRARSRTGALSGRGRRALSASYL